MNHGKRKYPALDVVNMFATLTEVHWRTVLEKAIRSGSVEKLVSYRYGLQAGLADASTKGLTNEKIDIWVLKRIRNVEKAMKVILRQLYKNPHDDVHCKKDPNGYIQGALLAKRKRDRAFEEFLKQSAF